MKKKLTLLLSILAFSAASYAQWDPVFNPTVAQDDIQFWTGTGSNRAVIAITWNDDVAGNIGIAWGVQWNGTTNLKSLMDTLNLYDPRLSVTGNGAISNLSYQDEELGLDLVGPAGYWWYNWKDANDNDKQSGGVLADMIVSGDFIDWLPMNATTFESEAADTMIMATAPSNGGTTDTNTRPFAAEDIQYWVGSGNGSSVVAISWDDDAEDVVALAWGVRYNDEYYPSVLDLLDSIKEYDSRFDYSVRRYMGEVYDIHTITYSDGTMNLAQTNTSSISAQVYAEEGIDDVSGSDLEYYSVWDGDLVAISTSGLFLLDNVEAVLPPAEQPEPVELCTTVYNLPYTEDFSGYTDDQSVRVTEVRAPMPTCWTVLGNGRFHADYDTTPNTANIYFAGIGYATSTNSYGCMEVGNPYFALIACQMYDGTYEPGLQNAINYGSKRFAILPMFDHPLGQTMLTFNRRSTANSGAALMIGYIINDTADFTAVDSLPMDKRITHFDTIHFSNYSNIPENARLTLLWKSTDTAHNGFPSNYYCGLDNVKVELDPNMPEPVPVEATIAASDILYWVGEGQNQAIMAINWPDTALAWGYRFDGNKTVANMVNDITAADPRLSYTTGTYGIDDILFARAEGDTLRKQANSWWSSTQNGVMDGGMGQPLHNNDFEKWAEGTTGVLVDSTWVDASGGYWDYTYVHPMTIHPVSVPDTTGTNPQPQPEHGPFCGAVGTAGCDAIDGHSSSIVAWATGVSVVRGLDDIAVPDGPHVIYGSENDAVGAIDFTSTTAVSLGDGGSATVTFARPIRNGEGPDFAVFENSFDDYFLELGFVEVSTDGERFVRFPATSLTQTDSQVVSHVDPTFINNLAGKYRVGYGTPFDLEELRDSTGINIDSIVYVRIIDVVGSIDLQYATYDAYGHIVNDPYPTSDSTGRWRSGGFDLTGVAVMYENTNGSSEVAVDATIDQDAILFWTGNGQNSAVIAVNWAAPDTCLAWGVKWNGNATVQDLMDTIVAYDSRFTYTGTGMLSDIIYTADGHTFQLTAESASPWGNSWMYNINGAAAQEMFNTQQVNNGDFVKWGDPNSGIMVDSANWAYVWTTTVTPVSVPTVGIDDVKVAIEALWPNPTTDVVNVSINRPVKAELYDLNGRSMAAFNLHEGTNVISLAHLNAGVYMLRAEGTVMKVVKK